MSRLFAILLAAAPASPSSRDVAAPTTSRSTPSPGNSRCSRTTRPASAPASPTQFTQPFATASSRASRSGGRASGTRCRCGVSHRATCLFGVPHAERLGARPASLGRRPRPRLNPRRGRAAAAGVARRGRGPRRLRGDNLLGEGAQGVTLDPNLNVFAKLDTPTCPLRRLHGHAWTPHRWADRDAGRPPAPGRLAACRPCCAGGGFAFGGRIAGRATAARVCCCCCRCCCFWVRCRCACCWRCCRRCSACAAASCSALQCGAPFERFTRSREYRHTPDAASASRQSLCRGQRAATRPLPPPPAPPPSSSASSSAAPRMRACGRSTIALPSNRAPAGSPLGDEPAAPALLDERHLRRQVAVL